MRLCSMLPATLFSPKLFPSLLRPLPSLRNNEVTVLNVSRTGDHREWGAKSPSTPCLVMARKGKGQFENRPLSFTAVRKCWRPFEKVKIFSGNGARHCLSPSPSLPPSIVEFHHSRRSLGFSCQSDGKCRSHECSLKKRKGKFYSKFARAIRFIRGETSQDVYSGRSNENSCEDDSSSIVLLLERLLRDEGGTTRRK